MDWPVGMRPAVFLDTLDGLLFEGVEFVREVAGRTTGRKIAAFIEVRIEAT